MCKPDSIGTKAATGGDRSLFLFSLKQFDSHNGVPSATAQIVTGAILILALIAIEQSLRVFFTAIKDFDPILDNETSRNVLARHVGVDALSAVVVSYFGYKARYVYQNLLDAITGKDPKAMPVAYEGRMFTYIPEGQRVLLFFTAYQIKNLADTIVWNDGILFIVHHILALASAWGGLNGHAQFYGLFYMGVSEISTGALCLLANFDDEFGVVGLGDAFPMTRAALGGIFVVLFVVCRVLLWTSISYYCFRDFMSVLKGSDPRKKGFDLWYRFTFFSLSILSLLQIIWLFEIGRIALEELEKIGLL